MSPSPLLVLRRSWRTLFAFIVPIALSPLLLDSTDKTSKCLFVLLLMVLYWMFEPINLYMTAFIPMALFPLLGIASTRDTAPKYMGATNMMFVSGLIIGIALEHCNLHRRIALKVIIFFGSSLKNLMAGVMVVTAFLSMWINNTATTAMMVPIVDSILEQIMTAKIHSAEREIQKNQSSDAVIEPDSRHVTINHNNNNVSPAHDAIHKQMKIVRIALLLSIAYSSNIGGTATLTGTGTNLVFEETFHYRFPDSTEITFTSWFLYAFPAAMLTLGVAWCLLYVFYLRKQQETEESSALIRKSALKKYEELGNITFHEYGVMMHFVALVLLWFLRDPGVFPGWANLVTDKKDYIKDAVPAFVIAISMFIIPANLTQFYSEEEPREPIKLLNWSVVQKKMSWGVIFLLGGGFALSLGTSQSGLNDQINEKLSQIDLEVVPTTIVLAIFAAGITEFASNVATASVILPVLSQLAIHHHVNPLFYMIPVTLCISFAFMLPVATPPNAIVYEQLKVSTWEMVKPGIFMNFLAVFIQLGFLHTVGRWMFSLDEFPSWAHSYPQPLPTHS